MSVDPSHPANTIATPEGDNEMPPDVPLTTAVPAPLRPRGDEPHSVEPLQNAENPPRIDAQKPAQE